MTIDVMIMKPAPKPERKKKRNKQVEYAKAAEKYRKLVEKKHGFPICESYECGCTKPEYWSVHHIMKKSHYGNHPEINNSRNLILLCPICHDGYHFKIGNRIDEFKMKEIALIRERKLDELFK